MSADDRALVEVATVIRAASGEVELPVARQRAAIEDALRQVIGAGGPAASGAAIVPLPRARRWAPWAIAGASSLVAVAALALLWLRGPRVAPQLAPAAPVAARVPATWRSRPADALVGRITVERAGDAATRIDTIFADRLDGYRERRLAVVEGGKP
jgi:hypothetical protein